MSNRTQTARGAWAELDAIATDLLSIPRSGIRRLAARNRVALAVMATWLLAVLVDGSTTLLMMRAGYEEANPVAAAVMAAVGVEVAVLAISAGCLLLGLVASAWPDTTPARTAVVLVAGIGVVKLAVGISNVLLALTGLDLL